MEKIYTAMWDELLETRASDASSELSGYVAVLPVKYEGCSALIDTRRLVVARRIMKLCKAMSGERFNGKMILGERSFELDKIKGRVQYRIPRGVHESFMKPPGRKWEWFRGAWGGCGALYLPQNGYYMALRLPPAENCRRVFDSILKSAGIVPKVRTNRGRAEYMIRDVEGIVTVLSRMGLVKTSLLLEETAVIRSVRGIANKIVNCDSSNIRKTLTAARAQMELIDTVDSKGLWGEIPSETAELARLRRANPSASLGELGQFLSKPVSKSTVEYRWRKLKALISEII
ncbi:MAG: DNA-binding protein WhiA [Synergistaceae bacterium]|jgi:DNA-binding protein WhiA|nr:DNA-binding protein WhiA [Synergistaceae bacterium]